MSKPLTVVIRTPKGIPLNADLIEQTKKVMGPWLNEPNQYHVDTTKGEIEMRITEMFIEELKGLAKYQNGNTMCIVDVYETSYMTDGGVWCDEWLAVDDKWELTKETRGLSVTKYR